MKTPMQELIQQLKQLKYSEINEQAWDAYDSVMDIAESMLDKEKEVAQQYAEFAMQCDRKKLPILEFDGWINL